MVTDSPQDVLIIDDEESIVEVLHDYCDTIGTFRHIVNATDGSMAANKLMNQEFSLILLDINMPKKSGTDVLREFERYRLNKISNVIVISGGIDKQILSLAAKCGVKHFLVKPFDEDTFVAKVSQVIKT